MYRKGNTLRIQYEELMGHYHNSNSKIMISKQITSPLAHSTPLVESFWNRVADLFEERGDIPFKSFVYKLLCSLAYALEDRTFAEWYSLSIKDERKELLSLLDKVRELEDMLIALPESALSVPLISALPDETGIRPQELAFYTRWGEAKKTTSLHTRYDEPLTNLKRDIALKVNYLNRPHYEKMITPAPAKQTKNKPQAELLNELIIFFEQYCPQVPRQIIIDLCHIYDFDDVDEDKVSSAIKRNRGNKNQTLNQQFVV